MNEGHQAGKKNKSKHFGGADGAEEPVEISRIKYKKNTYIKNCIQRNQHYTEEKLKSLNWMKKDTEDFQNMAMKLQEQKVTEKYKERQEIMAKYNQMSKDNGNTYYQDDGTYKYVTIRGNNSKLIRRVLQTREHWSELGQNHLKLFHFKWAPVSGCIDYNQLSINGQRKLVNHFEGHEALSTKDLLYHNMLKFCESNRHDVFQYLPIQFVLDFS